MTGLHHKPDRPQCGLPIHDGDVSPTEDEEELAGTEGSTYIGKPASTAVDSQHAITREPNSLLAAGSSENYPPGHGLEAHKRVDLVFRRHPVDLGSTVAGRPHIPHREEAPRGAAVRSGHTPNRPKRRPLSSVKEMMTSLNRLRR